MTINGGTNASNWTFKLEAYEIGSYSITNNTSTVRVDMYLGRSGSQSYLGGDWNGSITVDGQIQYLSGNIAYPTYINADSWLYLGTRDYTVTHNTDGSKVAGISASFSSGDFSPSSAWASGNLTLTTIPRASSVTATNADIGSATSININRASSSFTHTLKYSFGSLSGTIVSKTSQTSYGWTVPTTFYAQIPNAKSGICTITCETYSGNTLIGTKTTRFTATANETLCKPDISGTVVDINEDTIALTGDNTKFIKYYSNASVSWEASAKNSASVVRVYVNNEITTTSPKVINGITTNQIPLSVLDTRAYRTSINIDLDMIDYIPLTANVSFFRTEPTTGRVSLEFDGNYFNDSFGDVSNTLSLKWYYKLKDSDTWTLGGTLVNGTDYVITNNTFHSGSSTYTDDIVIGSNFDYQKAYDFKFEFVDELESHTIEQTVSKGIPIVNWDDDHFNVNGDISQYEQPFTPGGGGGETLPVGTIIEYPASSNLPTGWMICDGSAVSRTEYSQLFNVIGTKFGSGDGSTTFNIPNKKGRVSVGVDTSQTEFNTIGKTGGEKTHTLTIQEMPSHNHGITVGYAGSGNTHVYYNNNSGDGWLGTDNTGGDQPHNILQPYIVNNFIIKVSQTTGTNGQIVDSLDGNSTTDAPSQRAVNTLKPVELYNNTSGSNGTITLSDSSANYRYIEIYYKSNDNYYNSVKVQNPNNKSITLMNMTPVSTNIYIKSTLIEISGATITPRANRTYEVNIDTTGYVGITQLNTNYITHIIGYK